MKKIKIKTKPQPEVPDEWLHFPIKTYTLEQAPDTPIHNITLKDWPFCDCCSQIIWVRSDLPPVFKVIEENSLTGKLEVGAVFRITIYKREVVK